MQEEGPLSRTGMRVLVVEDNEDVARSLAMLLDLWGYDTRVVHEAEAALEDVRTHRPDVVLMDIGLPGKDGYQVAQQLRQAQGCKHVVLVAMTGYGDEEDRRRSEQAGFQHHLVKPVDPDVLQALLLTLKSQAGGRG